MIVARLISSGSFWAEGGLSGCDPVAAISPQRSENLHACFSIGVGYKLSAAAELCLEIMVQNDIEY